MLISVHMTWDSSLCGQASGFFASDNGAHFEGGHQMQFFDSTGGLPGHKAGMFEGSVRSPSMVRWPGHIQKGSSSDLPWAFWDVFPTLAHLAQAEIPSQLDGISILPELLGSNMSNELNLGGKGDSRYFYFTWVGDGGRYVRTKPSKIKRHGPGYTVRWGWWKGMVPHCWDQDRVKPSMKDRMLLFNLQMDPLETTDVAQTQPKIVQKLKELVVSENLTCICYQCFWPWSKARRRNLATRWRLRSGRLPKSCRIRCMFMMLMYTPKMHPKSNR